MKTLLLVLILFAGLVALGWIISLGSPLLGKAVVLGGCFALGAYIGCEL
jgi:hypothetical protein